MNGAGFVTGARHLDIRELADGEGGSIRLRRQRRRRNIWLASAALVLLVAALVGAAIVYFAKRPAGQSPTAETSQVAGVPALNLPAPDLVKPLTPQEAQQANEERPIDARADDPASRFRLSGDAISKLRAIDCLTQAIYYEAASEGVDGGRAVAQVVLNRVRHPAYPNTVCGVVYQGSQRTTGCQFTFTCDGSLARTPLGYLWQRSRLLASEALAGRVFPGVGHATHYHADYVVPYWAASLDKVAVIGRHIFYRLRGGAGARTAFAQPYRGIEPELPTAPSPAITLDLEALVGEESVSATPELPKVEADRVEGLSVQEQATAPAPKLEADLARGQLLLGDPEPSTGARKSARERSTEACESKGVQQITAVKADELKATQQRPSCP